MQVQHQDLFHSCSPTPRCVPSFPRPLSPSSPSPSSSLPVLPHPSFSPSLPGMPVPVPFLIGLSASSLACHWLSFCLSLATCLCFSLSFPFDCVLISFISRCLLQELRLNPPCHASTQLSPHPGDKEAQGKGLRVHCSSACLASGCCAVVGSPAAQCLSGGGAG